jgi:hypothetical protein
MDFEIIARHRSHFDDKAVRVEPPTLIRHLVDRYRGEQPLLLAEGSRDFKMSLSSLCLEISKCHPQ